MPQMRPLSPTFQQRMLTDPSYMANQSLIQNGTSMAPARGGALEAVARALTGGLAGANMRDLQTQYQGAQDSRNQAVIDALDLGKNLPAESKKYGDGTTINWNARPGSTDNVIQALAGNPETTDVATTMMGDQIKTQNDINAMKAKQEFEANAPLTSAQKAEQIVGVDGTVVPKYDPTLTNRFPAQTAQNGDTTLLPPPAGTQSGGSGAQTPPTAAQSVYGTAPSKQRTPTVDAMSPKAKLAYDEGVAKDQADKTVLYKSIQSKMPQVAATIDQLRTLAKTAAYSPIENKVNDVRRAMGQPVSQGAVDRAKYMATVRDVLLPQLRETFGAQFTQIEGEKLEASLGDPNLSPEEKDAALTSYLEQKMATLQSLGREIGAPPTVGVSSTVGGTTPTAPAASAQMAKPTSAQEFQALPSGTQFMAPDGTIRVKP